MVKRKVGLTLTDDANRTADAVSCVTGLAKCEAFERGLVLLVATLPEDQRLAVEAVRLASGARG